MQNTQHHPPLPPIFVGKDIVKKRIQRFRTEKHPLLSKALQEKGLTSQDTKSIWYSKEHVVSWLKEIELMDADGIRVYFGAYGKEEGRPEGQLCLLMVLTRAGNTADAHVDIILEEEPGFEDRKLNSKERSLNFGSLQEEEKPREYNYGAPCPPICPPPLSYFDE